MSVMKNSRVGPGATNTGVGAVSAATVEVNMSLELGLALILKHAWSGSAHDVDVCSRGNLSHIAHHFHLHRRLVHTAIDIKLIKTVTKTLTWWTKPALLVCRLLLIIGKKNYLVGV